MRDSDFVKYRVVDSEGHDGNGAQPVLLFNYDGSPLIINQDPVLLRSPNGTVFTISVTNDGTLDVVAVVEE